MTRVECAHARSPEQPMSRFASLMVGAALLAIMASGTPLEVIAAPNSRPLDELRRSFTVDGQPVPPEIFRDMGDGDMADSDPIWMTADVQAATGSNLYADPITVKGEWVTQIKAAKIKTDPVEYSAYRLVGMTSNKLLVVIASYSGGGTGNFYTLHILDARLAPSFDTDGQRHDRLTVTNVRNVPMGDRWEGSVTINGSAITMVTTAGALSPSTKILRAIRP
jgi:hypothetical protein